MAFKLDKTKIETKYYSFLLQDYFIYQCTSEDAKELRDFIDFSNISKDRSHLKPGPYTYYTASIKTRTSDRLDQTDEHVIICRKCALRVWIGSNFATSGDILLIKSKDNNVLLNKYLYYILRLNTKLINSRLRGAILKGIRREDIASMKIPILPISKQHEIVDILEHLDQELDSLPNQIKDPEELKNKTEQIKQKQSEIIYKICEK